MVDEYDRDELLQILKKKFEEIYSTFLGTGPLASSIYIDPKFGCSASSQNGRTESISLQHLYSDLIEDKHDSVGSVSNLIIADSGLGKTSLALHICKTFWGLEMKASIKNNDRIPIYIYLPGVVKHLEGNMLENLFTNETRLCSTLSKFRLLIILDGYDELKERTNNLKIFETINWTWPDVKVLVLSRNYISQGDKAVLLQYLPKLNDQLPKFVEYFIRSFENDQIDNFISKVDEFICKNSFHNLDDTPWGVVKLEYLEHSWNKDKYMEWFKRLTDLWDLAKNPLLLTLILQTLPKIVHDSNLDSNSIPDKVKKFIQTKVGIFDTFTENWFKFQYMRLCRGELPNELTWPIFKTFCYSFAQNLAYSLINRSPSMDSNFGLLEENSFLSTEVMGWKMLEIIRCGRFCSDDETACLNLFKKSENVHILNAIRNSCLIKYEQEVGVFVFKFFHRSIAEYFVSRDIFVELQGEFEYYQADAENICCKYQHSNIRGLNKYLLLETSVMDFLAQRVSSEPIFSDLLFKIVEKSKELSLISIMSANAISILNIAGTSFSGRDFRWIQIPGANLNHSLCGNADFKGANLENVSFEDAWLAGAKFNGAKLFKTNFGLNSSFKAGQQEFPLFIQFYKDVPRYEYDGANWFVYSLYICNDVNYNDISTPATIKVIKWDLQRIANVLEFNLQDEGRENFFGNCGFCFIDKHLIIWSESLCIFCHKTGKCLGKVLIPAIPVIQRLTGYNVKPNVLEQHFTQIYEEKLFVARGRCIRAYTFYDCLKNNKNLTLTCVLEYNIDKDFFKDDHLMYYSIIYEFIKGVGLVVVGHQENHFHLAKISEKNENIHLTSETNHTVEFDIVSCAIDSIRCQIALGGYEGILQIRTICTNLTLKKFKLPCAGVQPLKYSKDFKFLAAGAVDLERGHFVRVWETESWNILNSIEFGVMIANDFQLWSSAEDEEIILGVAFAEPQDGLQFFTVLFEKSRMVTQKKLWPYFVQRVSCSVDGTLIAAVLQNHRFNSELSYDQRPREYFVHVYSVENGQKNYGFEFRWDRKSTLLQTEFFVDNNIICIEASADGFDYYYIYDGNGCLIKSRIAIDYRKHCGYFEDLSSTGYKFNHAGNLYAKSLRNGSICLFELVPNDPFLQFKCHLKIPHLEPPCYVLYTTYFIEFDQNSVFLVSSATNDSNYTNSVYTLDSVETCTIRIWNILSKELVAEFSQKHFRYPHFYPCKDQIRLLSSSFGRIVSIRLTSKNKPKVDHRYSIEFSPLVSPMFDYNETFKLIILHAGPQLVQIWKIDLRSKSKLMAAINMWFDVTFLKFIPLLQTKSDQCKILITGKSNICCMNFSYTNSSLTLLWSHCSNLNLNVQGLCLHQCIQLRSTDHKELLARGAIGSMAHEKQRYISKSNVIVPILGSTILEPSTILKAIIQKRVKNRGRNLQLLNVSDSEWIMSAIGRRPNANSPISRVFQQHVFLTLEGIKNGRRFIFEAHLRYDKDKVLFQIFPTNDVNAFQKKYENCWVRQWQITVSQGIDLITDILSDYINKCWNTNF